MKTLNKPCLHWGLFWSLSLTILPIQAQENWPQFRGAESRGLGTGKDLPLTWSETENVRWKAEIPGSGWSSPIVWDHRVFLTTVENEGVTETPKKGLYFGGERKNLPKTVHRWKVLCLDFDTGQILWDDEVGIGIPRSTIHLKNTFASETPVTDGERVYFMFGNLGIFCYDLKGTLLWQKMLPARKTRYGWGTAASPVLHENRLYVINDNQETSRLTAYNAVTGEEVWKVDRDEKSNWATPYIWNHSGRTEIVTPGTGKTRSYDLNGRLLWEMAGMSTIVIPTPFSEFGLLYISSGYVGDKTQPVYAVRSGATGDITLESGERQNQYIAWSQKKAAPYNTSPLIYGDQFYVLWDRGFLSCRNGRTGEEIYEKQRIRSGKGTAFTASPWAYRDRIFCLSEDGDTFVFQAGKEYKLLHVNALNEMAMATPAIVRDSLIIRTQHHLFRISENND